MSRERATYVYCLVQGAAPPGLAGAPAGVRGCGRLRAIDAGPSRWLVVADAPLADYGEAALERGLCDVDWVAARALEHEAVVEHFLDAGAVIPTKLFTLFTSDERALADVRARAGAIERIVERIDGSREWGVRVFFDPARAEERRGAEPAAAGAASGREFLLQKKEQRDAAKRLTALVQKEQDATYAELASLARAARSRPPLRADGAGRLVLDAAFLVPAERAAKFQAAARRRADAIASGGFELVLSGPWPAYNFIEGEDGAQQQGLRSRPSTEDEL